MLVVLHRTAKSVDGGAIVRAAKPTVGHVELELSDFGLCLHSLDGLGQVVDVDAVCNAGSHTYVLHIDLLGF
jgi:hypothetical protein